MNTNSRTKNTVINITVSVVCQIIMLILSFIVRTFFIKLLGADYLGVNGLFSNILSILSMADLGIGAAITFALYKPIAENDEKKIQAYMNFFKLIYRIIAGIVFVLGCLCIPFLGYLINLSEEIPNLTLIYILQLLSTTASYICIYKSTLLIADQRTFITKIINALGVIIADILELLILIATHNYFGYLIMQLVSTIITNIITSVVADRMYPFLKRNDARLPIKEKKKLFSGIKAMIIYRIAGVILNATDNILISILISTTVVGIYSNYTMISGTINSFATLVDESLKGSIGSLTTEKNIENSRKNFKTLSLFNFWLYGFIAICLLILLNDFIALWLGKDFLLSKITVIAIVLNIYVPGSLMIVANFRDTTGIYMKTKYVYVFASIINLILSIVLGMEFGLSGIIFATSISRLVTSGWYEPWVLYKDYFKISVADFYLLQIRNFFILIISFIIVFFITKLIPTGSILLFMVKLSVCVVLVNVLFFLFFYQKEEFNDLLARIRKLSVYK